MVLWNTRYLDAAVARLRAQGHDVKGDADRLGIDTHALSATSTQHADEIVEELRGIEGVTLGKVQPLGWTGGLIIMRKRALACFGVLLAVTTACSGDGTADNRWPRLLRLRPVRPLTAVGAVREAVQRHSRRLSQHASELTCHRRDFSAALRTEVPCSPGCRQS